MKAKFKVINFDSLKFKCDVKIVLLEVMFKIVGELKPR